eukprot:643387-Hanusia_phi.AAC.2
MQFSMYTRFTCRCADRISSSELLAISLFSSTVYRRLVNDKKNGKRRIRSGAAGAECGKEAGQ